MTVILVSDSVAHIETEFLSTAECTGMMPYVGVDETLDKLKGLVL
jgi:hypothetical protein